MKEKQKGRDFLVFGLSDDIQTRISYIKKNGDGAYKKFNDPELRRLCEATEKAYYHDGSSVATDNFLSHRLNLKTYVNKMKN